VFHYSRLILCDLPGEGNNFGVDFLMFGVPGNDLDKYLLEEKQEIQDNLLLQARN